MPDPNTIPFKEADGNGHYRSKQLPQDRDEFLDALGLPTFAGDVVTASGSGTAGGEVATYWGTDGHTIKAATQTGLAKLTAGVLSSVAAPVGAVVGTTDTQTLTNKTLDNAAFTGTVSGLDKYDVGLGNVDNTSDANKPLSSAQTAAIAGKEDKPNKGVANGYAGLDTIGKVPLSQIPDAIIGASRYQGTWNAATNTPTIPAAAPANQGYYYNVAVGGSTNIDGISTWIVGDTIISNGSIWQKIPVSNLVQSVNAKTGVVVINQNDVGLGNVNNTSDATKNSAAVTLTNKTIDGANNTLNVRLNTADVSGNLPVTKLDSGTAASATTFWRGDGHWVSPAGGGDVQGPGSAVSGEVSVYTGTTGKSIGTFAGSMGFLKGGLNAAMVSQAQMGAGDLHPDVIHAQTAKATVLADADEFLVWDSSVSALRRVASSNVVAPGAVVQTVTLTIATVVFSNVVIPYDTTIPQNTEGAALFPSPLSITLRYATSKVLVTLNGSVSRDALTGALSVALFRDSVANAISARAMAGVAQNAMTIMNLVCVDTPGAGTHTYQIRYGPNDVVNMIWNGISGSGIFGASNITVMTAMEIRA